MLRHHLGMLQVVPHSDLGAITNSVMVIRVKYTAKPGKQFVIKWVAFRHITDALNAKGIYYAHRKVIVYFPAEVHQNSITEQTEQKALQAGAATVIAQQAENQTETKEEKNK